MGYVGDLAVCQMGGVYPNPVLTMGIVCDVFAADYYVFELVDVGEESKGAGVWAAA